MNDQTDIIESASPHVLVPTDYTAMVDDFYAPPYLEAWQEGKVISRPTASDLPWFLREQAS